MAMSEVKYAKHLDWITATFHNREFPFLVLPTHWQFDRTMQVPSPKNYKIAYRLECGGLIAISKDEKQGILVMLPGEALENLRNAGFSDQDTVAWLVGARNVSRADYAFNALGGDAKDHNSHDAYNSYKAGGIKTRMKLDSSYKDEKVEFGGQSYYFGSVHSDQRVICYDKRVERGGGGVNWTRVEYRGRNDYSTALIHDMHKFGVEKAGDAKLMNVWDADIEWFQQGLLEEKIELRKLPRQEPAFKSWLWATVLPSLRKHIRSHRSVIEDFYAAVGQILEDSALRD